MELTYLAVKGMLDGLFLCGRRFSGTGEVFVEW